MSLSAALASQENVLSALQNVPAQTGTAVLDLNGNVVSSTGDLANNESVVAAIFNMLQDTRGIIQDEKLKKLTVKFESYEYGVVLANNQILIVKKSTK